MRISKELRAGLLRVADHDQQKRLQNAMKAPMGHALGNLDQRFNQTPEASYRKEALEDAQRLLTRSVLEKSAGIVGTSQHVSNTIAELLNGLTLSEQIYAGNPTDKLHVAFVAEAFSVNVSPANQDKTGQDESIQDTAPHESVLVSQNATYKRNGMSFQNTKFYLALPDGKGKFAIVLTNGEQANNFLNGGSINGEMNIQDHRGSIPVEITRAPSQV